MRTCSDNVMKQADAQVEKRIKELETSFQNELYHAIKESESLFEQSASVIRALEYIINSSRILYS